MKQVLQDARNGSVTVEDVPAPQLRPGCVLVAVRHYHRMWHLERVLEKTNLRRQDIVVMTVRQVSAGDEVKPVQGGHQLLIGFELAVVGADKPSAVGEVLFNFYA